MAAEPLVQLGVLGKTYQLAGGLRLYPLGEAEAQALASLSEVTIEGLGPCRIRELRQHGNGFVLYLTRALSREAARALVNRAVFAPASALPEAEEDAIYADELAGLPVLLDGQPYGEVLELREAGLQDLLVIAQGGRELLVPLQAPYVVVTDDEVRLEQPPEGLLEP